MFTSREIKNIKGVRIIKLGLITSWDNLIGRISFIFDSFIYLSKQKYDLIHAFPFIAGLPAFLAGITKKTPVVFSVFALSSQSKKNNSLFSLSRILIEDLLTLHIPYTLLLTDNREFLKQHKKKKMVYIPDGVDLELFEGVNVRKSKYPQILFVGRFHKQKGIENLLKAMPIIIKKIPNIRLVMIGYGAEEQKIREYIFNNNLNSYVTIKSPRYGRDLASEYKYSHLLVLPSLYEGQGIVVLEAWAAKIPVIATRVGSLKDLIENDKNGYLVDPNNPYQLARRITELLVSEKRINMGRNGFNLVKEYYTWDKSVKKVYQEYKKLAILR